MPESGYSAQMNSSRCFRSGVTYGPARRPALALRSRITIWRVSEEGEFAATALGLFATAAVFGAVLALWLGRWVPKHWQKAGPVPADAEVIASHKARWWALLGGLVLAFAAVGRAADDSVIMSGVLTGIVLGSVGAFSVGIIRLQRRQVAHGQELLQWRRGGFRNPCHYLRDLDRPATNRFSREREAVSTR